MDDEETRTKLKELKDWYDYYMNRFFKRQGKKYKEKVRDHHNQITHLLKYGAIVPGTEFIEKYPDFKLPKIEREEHTPSRDAILKKKFKPLSHSVYDPSELVDTGDLLKSKAAPLDAEQIVIGQLTSKIKEDIQELKSKLGTIPVIASEHLNPDPNKVAIIKGIVNPKDVKKEQEIIKKVKETEKEDVWKGLFKRRDKDDT